MVLVKICGITNPTDALVAASAGADALGFNFFKGSPRYLAPAEARRIISELPAGVLCVGVFVNSPHETIETVVRESGVGAVQLHGDETPEFCAGLREMRVIKALRGGERFDPASVGLYSAEAILLDAYDPLGWGGTGRVCDWELARRVREVAPKLYLAGGLTPENVAEAVALVEPYAVDVASGVEVAPGRKDHALVRRFVETAKGAR